MHNKQNTRGVHTSCNSLSHLGSSDLLDYNTDYYNDHTSTTSQFDGDPNNIVGQLAASIIVLMIVTGVIGNLLVLAVIIHCRNLRRSYNVFIASLSVTDFLFNVSVMPFYAETYVRRHWRFNDGLCRWHTYFGTTLIVSSSLQIALIAASRYHVIVQPRFYSRWLSSGRAVAVQIGAVWTAAACIVLPGIVGLLPAKIGYSDQLSRCNYVRPESRGSLLLVFCGGFIVPCVVMCYCYVMIWRRTRQVERRINGHNSSNSSARLLAGKNRRRQLPPRVSVIIPTPAINICSMSSNADQQHKQFKQSSDSVHEPVAVSSQENSVVKHRTLPETAEQLQRTLSCVPDDNQPLNVINELKILNRGIEIVVRESPDRSIDMSDNSLCPVTTSNDKETDISLDALDINTLSDGESEARRIQNEVRLVIGLNNVPSTVSRRSKPIFLPLSLDNTTSGTEIHKLSTETGSNRPSTADHVTGNEPQQSTGSDVDHATVSAAVANSDNLDESGTLAAGVGATGKMNTDLIRLSLTEKSACVGYDKNVTENAAKSNDVSDRKMTSLGVSMLPVPSYNSGSCTAASRHISIASLAVPLHRLNSVAAASSDDVDSYYAGLSVSQYHHHHHHQQQQQQQQLQCRHPVHHKSTPGPGRTRSHSVRMILAVFLAFVCTYLPFTLTNLADEQSQLGRNVYMITSLGFWAGSCVNPLIYGIMNRQFRNAYRSIIVAAYRHLFNKI